ncbi:hypothetical protein AVEN_94959-1 [Araneus ventricosus]|uniref:MULE transposase domain-containing protein n=1 Tax=Araneus ventricosus TaxID=182803 RepID=A0A4Y2DKG6_ARAVE|nr:hypothetical protein AVEN_94959-1 [Araneus ventricosus]
MPSMKNKKEISKNSERLASTKVKIKLDTIRTRMTDKFIGKLKEKMITYRNCNVQVEFEENPFEVAIVTPIMKRSHCLPTSKEIIFILQVPVMQSHSVTFMVTPCAVGIFITKGQTEGSYKQGLHLILNILKESAFCNKEGPATFITDDSDAEISALKKTWPQSQHFLCIFHVGQAVWRWLWYSKNGIPNNYR